VQVDRDASHLGRRTRLDLGVQGDVGATLRAVLPAAGAEDRPGVLDKMLRRHAAVLEKVSRYTESEKLRPIHPEYVAALLDSRSPTTPIVTRRQRHVQCLGRPLPQPHRRRRIIGSFRARHHGQRPFRTPSAPPTPTPAARSSRCPATVA